MPTHFLLRIGDGENFKNSSSKSIWGISSKHPFSKRFITVAKEGDLLWFVKSKSKVEKGKPTGQLVAAATFTSFKDRILGPLVALTQTNEELGWAGSDESWDIEVHYKDLYNLTACELYSEIEGAAGIRPYNEKCKINLPEEYTHIVRYSKITNSM